MNKGILDEFFLDKNIEQIKFYSKEEKISLTKICNIFGHTYNNYNSPNTYLLKNNVNNLKNNINSIYYKRLKYVSILNKVIVQYHTTIKEITTIFNKDV